MTIAHKGTTLPFKTCLPIDRSTVFLAHYDVTLEESLKGLIPTSQVATLRFSDGKYGGGVAVEETTENVLSTSGLDAEAEYSGSSYPFLSLNITSKVLAKTPTGGTWSLQFEGKRDVGNGYPVMYVYFSDWSWSVSYGIQSYDWTKTEKTFTMPDPTGKTVIMAVYHMTSGSTGKSYARRLQVENKAFPTSFVNGTRSNNLLQYPLTIPDNVTISFWVKAKYASRNGGGYLFDTRGTDGNGFGMHQATNGTVTFFTRNSANTAWEYLQSSAIVTDDTYHQVVISIEKVGSNFVKRLYVDGNYQGSQTVGIYSFGSVLTIGSRYNNAEWTNGIFDEVRVDERVVPSDEIKEWYLSNAPFYPKGIHRIYG